MKQIQLDKQTIRVRGTLLRTARLDGEGYLFFDNPEQIIGDLRFRSERIDLLTFVPPIAKAGQMLSYPMEWDNLAAIKVTTFDDWWNHQIGFKARNKAKQAEKKGVTIHNAVFDEELARGIWEIYNETPIRQGRKFPHFGKDFATVYKESATLRENSNFIGAYFENKLIGFIRIVVSEDGSQAGLLNIVSKIEHRDKSPTNALVARAVRFCSERGISHLTYSKFNYGKRKWDTLMEFKERNAFQRVDIPRYYVPLTPMGKIAFRLGMHKKLLDRIPEPIIVKFRDMRAAFYKRTMHGDA